MNAVDWFTYGIEMAQKFCASGDSYADKGSAYIAEYEGISGTAAETEFCKGWETIVCLTGAVEMHQAINRMKRGNQ